MSKQITNILTLSDALAEHAQVTHWAISMRIAGKGDYIDRLRNGRDTGTKTAERVILKLSETWPADLEWPAGVPRPAPSVSSKGKLA